MNSKSIFNINKTHHLIKRNLKLLKTGESYIKLQQCAAELFQLSGIPVFNRNTKKPNYRYHMIIRSMRRIIEVRAAADEDSSDEDENVVENNQNNYNWPQPPVENDDSEVEYMETKFEDKRDV